MPHSSSPAMHSAALAACELLPVLPTTLPRGEDGTWRWLSMENDHSHRDLRRQDCQQLRSALEAGVYGVQVGDEVHIVHLRDVAKMLQHTRILSTCRGLPELPQNPCHRMQAEAYKGGANQIATALAVASQKVALVNAASAYHCGGGFTTGGRHALEEALCSQSTLFASLHEMASKFMEADSKLLQQRYIPIDGCIVSPHVEFLREGTQQGYRLLNDAVKLAAIVSIGMFNCNPSVRDSPMDAPKDQNAYEQGIRKKFDALVHGLALSGADVIVFPDVGCGVFKNDPALCGRLAAESLLKYQGYFSRIVFTGTPAFYESALATLRTGLAKTKDAAMAGKQLLSTSLAMGGA